MVRVERRRGNFVACTLRSISKQNTPHLLASSVRFCSDHIGALHHIISRTTISTPLSSTSFQCYAIKREFEMIRNTGRHLASSSCSFSADQGIYTASKNLSEQAASQELDVDTFLALINHVGDVYM